MLSSEVSHKYLLIMLVPAWFLSWIPLNVEDAAFGVLTAFNMATDNGNKKNIKIERNIPIFDRFIKLLSPIGV